MDYWGGPKGMLAPLPNYWGGLAPLAPLFLRLCSEIDVEEWEGLEKVEGIYCGDTLISGRLPVMYPRITQHFVCVMRTYSIDI